MSMSKKAPSAEVTMHKCGQCDRLHASRAGADSCCLYPEGSWNVREGEGGLCWLMNGEKRIVKCDGKHIIAAFVGQWRNPQWHNPDIDEEYVTQGASCGQAEMLAHMIHEVEGGILSAMRRWMVPDDSRNWKKVRGAAKRFAENCRARALPFDKAFMDQLDAIMEGFEMEKINYG